MTAIVFLVGDVAAPRPCRDSALWDEIGEKLKASFKNDVPEAAEPRLGNGDAHLPLRGKCRVLQMGVIGGCGLPPAHLAEFGESHNHPQHSCCPGGSKWRSARGDWRGMK